MRKAPGLHRCLAVLGLSVISPPCALLLPRSGMRWDQTHARATSSLDASCELISARLAPRRCATRPLCRVALEPIHTADQRTPTAAACRPSLFPRALCTLTPARGSTREIRAALVSSIIPPQRIGANLRARLRVVCGRDAPRRTAPSAQRNRLSSTHCASPAPRNLPPHAVCRGSCAARHIAPFPAPRAPIAHRQHSGGIVRGETVAARNRQTGARTRRNLNRARAEQQQNQRGAIHATRFSSAVVSAAQSTPRLRLSRGGPPLPPAQPTLRHLFLSPRGAPPPAPGRSGRVAVLRLPFRAFPVLFSRPPSPAHLLGGADLRLPSPHRPTTER